MKTNKQNLTGANRGNGGRNLNLRFLCSLLLKFARDAGPRPAARESWTPSRSRRRQVACRKRGQVRALQTGCGFAATGLYCLWLVLWLVPAWAGGAAVNEVVKLSPGVYFHEGDLKGHGHCNNGWIVFEDFVLVIDANFPSGAKEILPKIKASSERPVRFAFDTHHHGDHAYGNLFWVENGAVPVAHTGVIQEMMKYETGYYRSKPGRWEAEAKKRQDVAASRLKPPPLLFQTEMIFDDGRRRVELRHFGVAHTHGDGFAWLPKEKILFTGDACVNGPYNYTGDGNIEQWIQTLAAAEKLGAKTVCPGHGPVAGGELLGEQKSYFVELRKQVKKQWRSKPPEMQARVESIREMILKQPRIAKYVGEFFPAQVEKVYTEMGGKAFPEAKTAAAF